MMMMMMKEGVTSVTVIVGVVAVVGVAFVTMIICVVAVVGVAVAGNVRESSVVWITTEVGVTWDATFVQVTDGTGIDTVGCKYLSVFEQRT